MRIGKVVLVFLQKRNYFLILTVFAVCCLCQSALAQSGRKPKNNVSPSNPPEVAAKPAATDSQLAKPTERISSIIVIGELQHDYLFYRSGSFGRVIRELVENLKRGRPQLSVVERDSVNIGEAKNQAKKEIDSHILWLGFVLKDDACGHMIIDYIDYAVIKPETAKFLTSGKITPRQPGIFRQGGILRLPTATIHRDAARSQMREGAQQIAQILTRGGWL